MGVTATVGRFRDIGGVADYDRFARADILYAGLYSG